LFSDDVRFLILTAVFLSKLKNASDSLCRIILSTNVSFSTLGLLLTKILMNAFLIASELSLRYK